MQAIDIHNILTASVAPEHKAIEKALKKGFSLYFKCLANEDPIPAEPLIQLGRHFEQKDSHKYGFEKMQRALFCYALAARAGSDQAYKNIIFLLKKRLYVEEFYDYASQELLKYCYAQRCALKSSFSVKRTDLQLDDKLFDLYVQFSSQKNTVLVSRLDTAFVIYQYVKTLSLQSLLSVQVHSIQVLQAEMLTFMQAVLNVEGDEKVNALMKEREAIKHSDPECIPGKKPHEKPLLNVRDNSKEKDKVEGTIFLSAEDRDEFRAIIIKGEFFERQMDNRFSKVDTSHRFSHNKSSFVAYTLNAKGEIFLFDHFEINDGFAHSSMNAGAPLFISGEMQILEGRLKGLTVYSMHYQPKLKDVYEVLVYFKSQGVDISDVTLHTWGEEGNRRGNDFLEYNAAEFFEKFPSSGLKQCRQLNKKASFEEGFGDDFEVDFSANLTIVSGEEKKINSSHMFSPSSATPLKPGFDPAMMGMKNN